MARTWFVAHAYNKQGLTCYVLAVVVIKVFKQIHVVWSLIDSHVVSVLIFLTDDEQSTTVSTSDYFKHRRFTVIIRTVCLLICCQFSKMKFRYDARWTHRVTACKNTINRSYEQVHSSWQESIGFSVDVQSVNLIAQEVNQVKLSFSVCCL